MKKKEIKKDVIGDRIIGFANYISENTKTVWISIGLIIVVIFMITFFSAKYKNNLLESNLTMGLIQNRAINNTLENDSLLLQDYKDVLDNSIGEHDYNQAFIYILSDAIKKDNKDYIVELLSNNQFSSDDDMLNAFLYKVKADYLYSSDIDNYARYHKQAINMVPNYELKIEYGTDLIDLYINQSDYKEANNVLQLLKNLIGDEKNLSLSAKNNLDFIESKINQLIN